MKVKLQYFIISIADFLFLTLFFYLSLLNGIKLLNDCDTGYHIRTGEYILDKLTIPRYDIFSFHTPPIPWTAHEWLSEVIMGLVYRLDGLTGIVIFFSLIISLTYYIFFKILRNNSSNILVPVLFVLLTIVASQIHWLARPHIFSLLLTVIWYYLIDEYQYQDKNRLYFLPILMLLWVNLHGGFIAGFLIIAIYMFGNLVLFLTSEGDAKLSYKKKLEGLAFITVICLLVSLINPRGYHILLFPFNLISQKPIMDSVNEFLSPNFHDPSAFKYMLFVMIAVFAWSREKINIIEIILVLVFTNMALFSVRYIPLFAIITTPVVMRKTEFLLDNTKNRFTGFLKTRGEGIAAIDGSSGGFFWPVLGLLVVIFIAGSGKLDYGFDPKLKPVAAVEFLKKEYIAGNMFNNDEFGDYIIYAASPQYKVFFDGRLDMYGVGMLKEYSKVVNLKPDWDMVLDKYKVNWIIFDAGSPLSVLLTERKDWKRIYSDKVADIFVRNVPENQNLIEKHGIAKRTGVEGKD